MTDYPGIDLLGDHEHERCRQGISQGLLDRRRIQQPEGDVEVFAIEAPAVIVNLASVHDRAQPKPQGRVGDRRVVLDEQVGKPGYQPVQQHRLWHVVMRPDQDQHAVAAVGQLLEMPRGDPGLDHGEVQQFVQYAVQRYREYLGPDHTETLRASANLINDRRAVEDLARAEELGREVYDRCREAGFPSDIGYAAMVSLASVWGADGRPDEARKFDLQARDGLIEKYGETHPFSLAVGINYAADLAACSGLAEAIRIGHAALAKCRVSLGEDHPDTLIAASNLALDEAASGDQAEADRLLADVLRRYQETLTAEHPAARAAAQRIRLTAEIELY